jgi:hypothetical protein
VSALVQELPLALPAAGPGAPVRRVTRLWMAQTAAAGQPGLGEPGPADGELGQA